MRCVRVVTPERRAKSREVLALIAADAKADAISLDGQPFTGATVAPALGNILAMVNRLALIVGELLEDES